jgi:hypothetical protein
MRKLRMLASIVRAGLIVLSLATPAVADVPNTLEEAFRELDRVLPMEEKERFKRKPELAAVLDAHLSLGMGIRNEWFRSGRSALAGYLSSLGAQHFDDMSSVVLGAYWRYLNGRPIEIEKYVEQQNKCFARLLEEQKRDLAEAKGGLPREALNHDCP